VEKLHAPPQISTRFQPSILVLRPPKTQRIFADTALACVRDDCATIGGNTFWKTSLQLGAPA